jgi:hypothetical protein
MKPNELVEISEQDLIRELIGYQNPQDLSIEEAQMMEANRRPSVELGTPFDVGSNEEITCADGECSRRPNGKDPVLSSPFRCTRRAPSTNYGHEDNEGHRVNTKRSFSDASMHGLSMISQNSKRNAH